MKALIIIIVFIYFWGGVKKPEKVIKNYGRKTIGIIEPRDVGMYSYR